MNKENKWFYISLTIISTIVLILEKAGPFADKLRFVGFALFTIFCVAIIIENKNSKGKIFGAILYFLFGLVVLLK
ncbi:hypothetical protein HFZ78_21525 [Priestia megaterium]|uniref:Uncharacterized protein n=1 Tax=Priestia megaterium TaxID=1404 RepID=A0A6H1P6R4_PRIMG|nr:hypothetical protein [Priestia megaterium]QIZ08961.1 hypothetical protein HFZ78_21525 [Priestia megaterium]